jgi:periplasmic protein TonB
MFTTLVESRAVRQRSISGTITSVVLHAAAIAAAVALSVTRSTGASEAPTPVKPMILYRPAKPTPPVPQPARASNPQPAQPSLPTAALRTIPVPVSIPTSIPPIDFTAASTRDDEPIFIGGTRHGLGTSSLGTALSGAPGDAVEERFMERAPRVLGDPVSPRYPNALRERGIAGQVVIRFVIDTLGRAEPGSVVVLDATHPLFAESVKNVLGSYRFSPGEIAGKKLRTLVQMPFAFTLR